MTPIERDLARVRPHVSLIREVCSSTGEHPYRFAALGLRESGWMQGAGYEPKGDPCGWGDHGNGFGPFQIDKRYHAVFLERPESRTLKGQAMYACRLLRENRFYFRKGPLYSQDVERMERQVYAAYNAGCHGVYKHVVLGHDPDCGTTGKNYSAWIFRKADELKAADPDLFSPPVQSVA